MSKLEQSLAALPAMSKPQLEAEWAKVHGDTAPGLPIDLLRRGIAFRLQERSRGGMAGDTRRQLRRLTRQLAETGSLASTREIELKVGTRLVREWHGKMHHVLVLEDGFLFEDRRYTSLTSIAADITGTNWSGPRFFGMRPRRRPFAKGGGDE
ncbi:DUF2924 domain-containing protein [Sphingomonadaceae bacterium G21617-S1]|nr:DUF2924 domain-containing protein [Sphingomonadaceae bacterium G21617-S1]